MKISPLDMRMQTFRTTLRGSDPVEVRVFLDLAASELEDALQEMAIMAEKIRNLDTQLADYRALERSLRDGLVTVERLASEKRKESEVEAQRMIQEAQSRAVRILDDACDRRQRERIRPPRGSES